MSVDCLTSTRVQKDYRSWNTMSWSWLLYGAEIGGREQSSWEPPREGSRVERAGIGRPRGSFCHFYYPDSLGKPTGKIIHSTFLNRCSLIFMTWAFGNLIYRHLPQSSPQSSQILKIVKFIINIPSQEPNAVCLISNFLPISYFHIGNSDSFYGKTYAVCVDRQKTRTQKPKFLSHFRLNINSSILSHFLTIRRTWFDYYHMVMSIKLQRLLLISISITLSRATFTNAEPLLD